MNWKERIEKAIKLQRGLWEVKTEETSSSSVVTLNEYKDYCEELTTDAKGWITCKVGEEHQKNPSKVVYVRSGIFYKICRPIDETLDQLGGRFYEEIENKLWDDALETIQTIEKYVAKMPEPLKEEEEYAS